MGFWDSIKNFGRKALEVSGNIVKKVGEIGSPVLRKISEWAPSVTSTLASVGDILGAYLERPDIVAASEGLRLLGNPISKYSGMAADWLDSNDVGKYGDMAVNLSKKIK